MQNRFSAIILAAGMGKRMNSTLPKVLHPIGDESMIVHTVNLVNSTTPAFVITVISKANGQEVKKIIGKRSHFCIQEKQLGTANATQTALKQIPKEVDTVAVFYGDDTVFYDKETVIEIYKNHQSSNADITFVSLIHKNPKGLGRVVRENGEIIGIVEEKDASPEQLKSEEVTDGLYFFKKNYLENAIVNLEASPVTGEYYLTDLINLALKDDKKVEAYQLEDASKWHGVNTQEELKEANEKFAASVRDTRIHIMGISGAGAAAVAGIASASGFKVSGCDLQGHSVYSHNLDVEIEEGHSPDHIQSVDMLIVSPAVTILDPKNKEIEQAKRKNIPVLTWQEFQGKFLQKDKYVITVAGAYGKSTTTTMIAKILIDANLDPTVEIGAKVTEWNSNYKVGNSKYYICESDEYNNNFLNYYPTIAIILNIGWDHPDFFKTRESLVESYRKFIGNIQEDGTLIIPNDPELEALAKSALPSVKVVKIGQFGDLKLSIIGDFRKENANAALTVAKVLNLDLDRAKYSIESFKGIGRRLELKGEIKTVSFYDDYAVQPYTVLKTANALKEKYSDKKVVLVFEPHTFSRVEKFFDDFVKTLKEVNADQIFVTSVYPARESGDVAQLSKKIAGAVGGKTFYTGSIEQTADHIKNNLANFDVVLTMGAGNVYKIYDLLRTAQF
ncbi:NTP transferase domain-containing protein [Candidatus Curtissbacteria bacterium]|nr:NTP transferase domain-containing protein [Candidatus Curtissbacteria bacterium]